MKKILFSVQGFSLIELIVIIAIVGILVGISTPFLMNYVEDTKLKTDFTNLKTVEYAARTYVVDHSDQVPVNGENDITKEVAEEKFGGQLPILKSKYATNITIKVDSMGNIIVTPTQENLIKPPQIQLRSFLSIKQLI